MPHIGQYGTYDGDIIICAAELDAKVRVRYCGGNLSGWIASDAIEWEAVTWEGHTWDGTQYVPVVTSNE